MPATPVNVLYVIANTDYGGGQRTFEIIAESLPREAFTPHVACDPSGRFWERMGELGVCRHAVAFDRTAAPGRAGQLARLIRQERIGLVHSQSRRADFSALTAARRCRVPIISHVAARTAAFDVPPPLRWIYGRIERWMERRFTLQICVAEPVRQAVLAGGAAPNRVIVIPEAIDTARHAPGRLGREDACRQLGLDPALRWMGSLGRLIPVKGYEVLIEAAAQARDLEGVGWFIAGEGPLAAALQERVRRQGLERRVRLLPFQQDAAAAYAAMDLLVFPSRWGEAFPRVLLEAASFGKPAIASDLPACRAVLGQEPFACFVAPGDAGALAAGMRRTWQARDRLAAWGEQARRYVVERYDVGRVMPQVIGAYRRVLEQHA